MPYVLALEMHDMYAEVFGLHFVEATNGLHYLDTWHRRQVEWS